MTAVKHMMVLCGIILVMGLAERISAQPIITEQLNHKLQYENPKMWLTPGGLEYAHAKVQGIAYRCDYIGTADGAVLCMLD